MSRGLQYKKEKSDTPGPGSYDTLPEPYIFMTRNSRNNNTEGIFIKQPKIKGGTIGTRDRSLDLTRFNQHHNKFIEQGFNV